ncbi:MAG: hypothetical protein PWQ70_2471 [Clostridiales bacterium]|jgi:hypothetical protein|nr:hypothetical protein [Clostridiales bacterium]
MEEKKTKNTNSLDKSANNLSKGDLDDFIFAEQDNKKCSEK